MLEHMVETWERICAELKFSRSQNQTGHSLSEVLKRHIGEDHGEGRQGDPAEDVLIGHAATVAESASGHSRIDPPPAPSGAT
jgi:hypothetical protein